MSPDETLSAPTLARHAQKICVIIVICPLEDKFTRHKQRQNASAAPSFRESEPARKSGRS